MIKDCVTLVTVSQQIHSFFIKTRKNLAELEDVLILAHTFS